MAQPNYKLAEQVWKSSGNVVADFHILLICSIIFLAEITYRKKRAFSDISDFSARTNLIQNSATSPETICGPHVVQKTLNILSLKKEVMPYPARRLERSLGRDHCRHRISMTHRYEARWPILGWDWSFRRGWLGSTFATQDAIVSSPGKSENPKNLHLSLHSLHPGW